MDKGVADAGDGGAATGFGGVGAGVGAESLALDFFAGSLVVGDR